ncbi:MAG: sulfatase [Rubripirellula sp.]
MIRVIASFLVSLCVAIGLSCAAPPDIVMIAIDDLRPMLGCYGDSRIRTPNIDAVARRGVVFDRAYCQYAKCGTSRLSLMSGLRPDAVGVFSNNTRDVVRFRQRRPDATSLAQWLKQAGYHTQSFGKIYHDGWDHPEDWSAPSFPGRDREMWEVIDPQNPNAATHIAERLDCPVLQSADVPDEHFFAGRMTRRVIQTLDSAPQDAPLFLAVGYRRPHLPFVAPQAYFDLYQPDETWLSEDPFPPADSPIMAWFNSDGYIGSAKRVGLEMPLRPDREQAVAWNGYEMRSYVGVPNEGEISREKQIRLLHAYAACISYVDAQLGKILRHVQQSERFRNATIILWSDHGWHLGEHSAWGKMTNFEIATRVPLIIASDRFPPARTQSIAELVDLYPTLCDLAGIPRPAHLQGESLLGILKDPTSNADSLALSQYSRFQDRFMGRALRTDRYRFVAWFDQQTDQVVARELYDHRADARERQNLAADKSNAAIVKVLEAQLLREFELER